MGKSTKMSIKNYANLPKVIEKASKTILFFLFSFCAAINANSQNPLAAANGFNILTQNNLTINGGDIEGAFGAGGNFIFTSGNYLGSTPGTGNPYVTIGGNSYVALINGQVIYPSSGSFNVDLPATPSDPRFRFGTSNSEVFNNANNQLAKGSGYLQFNNLSSSYTTASNFLQSGIFNFTTAFTTLKSVSTSMAACANTVTLTQSGGSATMSALGNGANVLNITEANMDAINNLSFTNLPSATQTLIININGSGTQSFTPPAFVGLGRTQAQYIIWNFYNATTLTIDGNVLEGSVLAPLADLTKGTPNIEGQIIAKSFNQASSGEVHIANFNGVSCTVTCAAPNITTQPSAVTICNGATYATMSVVATGSSLTYLWQYSTDNANWSSAGNPGNTTSTLTINNYSTPIYYRVIVNSGSCSTTSNSALYTVNTIPTTPTVNTTAPSCSAAGATIITNYSASNTYTFSPTGPTVGSGGTITGAVIGTAYTVKASNATCTSATASFTNLAQLPVPTTSTYTQVDPTCTVTTGSFTITAPTGTGMTYIVDGAAASTTTTYSSLVAGSTHTIVAKNASGCTSGTTTVTIGAVLPVPSTPTYTQVNPTCTLTTGSFTTTAPTGTGMTYIVDGAAASTTTTYSSLVAGSTHTIVAKNASGCTSGTTTVTIGALVSTYTIGDFVWVDANNNGIQDAGELGKSGIIVNLYTDNNTDNIPDGTAIATTTTTGSGLYSFPNLCTGNYIVSIVLPAGYFNATNTATSANPNNATTNDNNGIAVYNTTQIRTNTVILNANNPNVDFGIYAPASLGNFVWNDLNANGIQDAGEPGIAGDTVRLVGTSSGSTPSGKVVTDANGKYTFSNLLPGTYNVTFDTPTGYTNASPSKVGTDSTIDSNPIAGLASGRTLISGQSDSTIDAGFYKTASIGDYVWFDWNGDGIQNKLEDGVTNELPAAGIKMYLLSSTNVILDSTITNGVGFYSFTNLTPGNYYVKTNGGNIYSPTLKFQGTDSTKDNNFDSTTGKSNLVSLVSGQYNNTIDCGLIFKTNAISDPCVCKNNATDSTNGQFDENVIVTATPGGIWRIIAQTGMYLETSPAPPALPVPVPLGTLIPYVGNAIYNYKFVHIDGVGYIVTVTDGKDTLHVFNTCTYPKIHFQTFDTTVCLYSAPIPFVINPTVPGSAVYTITTSGNTQINVTSLDPKALGLGSYKLQITYTPTNPALCTDTEVFNFSIKVTNNCLSSLGDHVWNDLNKNGVQDAGEPGVAGVTVTLYDSTGKPIASTVTDAYGNYLFTKLIPAKYTVGYTLPSNYTFTQQNTTTGDGSGTATDSDPNPTTGVTRKITLAEGQNNMNADAGIIFTTPPATSSVGDYVWLDTNYNGVQDAGEPGISGVTVSLVNSAGQIVGTTITDANGKYLFTNVTAGTYTVQFTAPPGMVFSPTGQGTTSTDSNPNSSGVTTSFTLTAGTTNLTIDAGLYPQPTTVASLGDYVWNDLNQNGVQDAGEQGIPGVMINLYSTANPTTPIATTTTDVYGKYMFTNLTPGTYIVGFTTATGYTPTTQNAAAATTATDSDPNTTTGKTATITLAGGDRNTTIDAGYYQTTPLGTLQLGDYVWNDVNSNGTQDAGEIGVAGVTATLYNSTGTAIATTSTDVNGKYLFTNLAAGTYTVGFSNIPSGYSFTAQTVSSATSATDSNPNTVTGKTNSINLTANNLTIDAGLVQGVPAGLGSIGDYVWYDINSNGKQDAGETGVAGVTVKLYQDVNNDGQITGAEQTPIATTTTNALGKYIFSGLNAGVYQVGFSNFPAGYTLTATKTGSDTTIDNNGNTIGIAVNGNPASATTSLTTLIELPQGADNMTVDAGIIPPLLTYALGDYVWLDANGNGLQDAGEPGVPGVVVTLYNSAGTAIATTTSDANGQYLFTGLPSATYSVGFGNLPAGLGFTTQSATNTFNGSDANTVTGMSGSSVTLSSVNPLDVSLDAGLVPTNTAALGDYVWYDANGNGVQDVGEASIPGVTVTLYRPGFGLDGIAGNADDALPVTSAITDANGKYLFTNLTPGTYQETFTTVPNNVVFTQQLNAGSQTDNTNSDANAAGQTMTIPLVAGQVNLTIDAGLTPTITAAVGDYVWYDGNQNVVQDATESGVPGVIATLYNSSNVAIAAAVTDGSGKYLMTNVTPGIGYYMAFTSKPTSTQFTTQTSNLNIVDPTLGSDPNATTGITNAFALAAGTTNLSVDAGLFAPLSLSGNVWFDKNALADSLVNNSSDSLIPIGIRAYLVNATTGLVVAKTTVSQPNPNFSYSFNNLTPNTIYKIVISTVNVALGAVPPTSALPVGWQNTGAELGTAKFLTATQLAHVPLNGSLLVLVGTTNVTNVNFGISILTGNNHY